jgi:hypothetical protein
LTPGIGLLELSGGSCTRAENRYCGGGSDGFSALSFVDAEKDFHVPVMFTVPAAPAETNPLADTVQLVSLSLRQDVSLVTSAVEPSV